MAIGDIYQAQVFYNLGSEITMNVVHLKELVASADDVPAETVAQVVYTNWDTFYPSVLFCDQSSVVLIQTRRIKPTPGVPSTLVLGTVANPVISGGNAGRPVPSTSALLISLYSDVFTRSGRGRIYFPGLDTQMQNDGQLVIAAIPLADDIVDILESTQVAVGPGTGEWDYCIYSRVLGTAQIVSQAVLHTNLATQRGRRNFPGIGT